MMMRIAVRLKVNTFVDNSEVSQIMRGAGGKVPNASDAAILPPPNPITLTTRRTGRKASSSTLIGCGSLSRPARRDPAHS